MIRLSIFIVACCLFISSCSSSSSNHLSEILPGNWLIVYPDHQLKSIREREVYGKYQDSIISIGGLKLISLSTDGAFVEMDSFLKIPGKWIAGKDDQLIIREAGKGFNPFKADFKEYKNNELLLAQHLLLDGERIKIVWHLKKINDDNEAAKLFSAGANEWRKKPTAAETEPEIKKRLAAMLHYYCSYFNLVANEAIYFLGSRVPLPVNYYQHAIGLKEKMPPAFLQFFYNEEDAAKAYEILGNAINSLAYKFERNENFVIGYSLFLKKIASTMQN